MTHWPSRLLRAYGAEPWFIDPRRGMQIIEALAIRAEFGPVAAPARDAADPDPRRGAGGGNVAVLNLFGTIAPRVAGVDAMSGDFAALDRFQAAFRAAADRDDVSAIVLNIDSPGGVIDQVPETAAMIRAAKREGRPIIAVANTLAASAAYWIASAADELSVSPSGEVGSIGVFTLHQDVTDALEMQGVRVTIFREGARKIEFNPFEPLNETSAAALQARVREGYAMFVKDVARHRGVAESVVRADPEDDAAEAHFGGGRVYGAREAVRRGMADRVETLDEAVRRAASGGRAPSSRRRRMALA